MSSGLTPQNTATYLDDMSAQSASLGFSHDLLEAANHGLDVLKAYTYQVAQIAMFLSAMRPRGEKYSFTKRHQLNGEDDQMPHGFKLTPVTGRESIGMDYLTVNRGSHIQHGK